MAAKPSGLTHATRTFGGGKLKRSTEDVGYDSDCRDEGMKSEVAGDKWH
jgi:hypothetical protein